MRIEKNKNQLLLSVLAVGFFIGILYENLFAGKGGTVPELFQKSYLQKYLQMKVVTRTYLWYVVKARVLFLAVFCLAGLAKWKRIAGFVCLGLIGFLFGILTVSSVLQLGAPGLFFCIVGLIPHGLFYGIGFLVIIYHWYRNSNRKWDHTKTLFVCGTFIVGILSEVYINPWLMKLIIPIVLR